MSIEAAPVTETSTPTVSTETTTPAPESAPSAAPVVKANTLAAVKAARRETVTPQVTKPEAGKPPEAAKTETKPVTAEIDMDEAELKAATQISREAREAKSKLKEAETKVSEAGKFLEVRDHISKGDHLKAAELAGIDINAAVAQLLAIPSDTTEDDSPTDPKLAEIAKTLEDLKARDAKRESEEATQKAEAAKAARDADLANTKDYVKKESAKFTYLSRNPAWVDDAYQLAADTYPAFVKTLGHNPDATEIHRFMVASLEEAEAQRAEEAKLYTGSQTTLNDNKTDPTPSKTSARSKTITASLRGGINVPVTKTKTKQTLSEVKKQRRMGG